MSDPTETARRVLDLDKQATQGPWTPQTVEGVDSDTFSAAGPEHSLTDDEDDDERDNAMDRAQADAALIAEYRTAAPDLARALLESQAARDRALNLAARGSDMAKDAQAALAAAPGLVTVRAKIVALRNCKCEASSGCMRAQWEAEVLAVVDAAHNAARLKGGE